MNQYGHDTNVLKSLKHGVKVIEIVIESQMVFHIHSNDIIKIYMKNIWYLFINMICTHTSCTMVNPSHRGRGHVHFRPCCRHMGWRQGPPFWSRAGYSSSMHHQHRHHGVSYFIHSSLYKEALGAVLNWRFHLGFYAWTQGKRDVNYPLSDLFRAPKHIQNRG